MTVTSKWVALHEVSDYLAKGWREVQIIGGPDDAALMVSPEELASEPAKVECPNCLHEDTGHAWKVNGELRYSCAGWNKPAPPEPVAAEMPEAVLVNTWQLEELLKYADLAEVSIRTGFAPPSFLGVDLPYLLRNAIAAVRAQAAEAGIKLPKVRAYLERENAYFTNLRGNEMLLAAIAELDTAEGRK